MTRRIGTLVAGVFLVLAATAGPAAAAPTDDTTFTLNLETGALNIDVTNSAATLTPNPVAPGSTATASFGVTTVTDTRAAPGAGAAWTATVDFPTGTDCPRDPTPCGFVNGATTPATIADSAVSYISGSAGSTTGDGTFTPGGTVLLSASNPTAFSHGTDGGGNNTCTWTPTLSVDVPANATDSSPYTAIVRHSVA